MRADVADSDSALCIPRLRAYTRGMRLSALILVALIAILSLPAAALAVDAEPEAIHDPPAAFEDAESAVIDLDELDATPAAAAAAPAATRGGGAAASVSANTAPIAARQPASGSTLPFTGVSSDLAVAMGLLGVLLLAGGIALLALPARAVHASAR